MNRLPVFVAACALLLVAPACKRKGAIGGDLVDAAPVGSAGAKESTPKVTGVTFTKKDPTVGVKRSEETHTTTAMKMTVMKKKVTIDEADVTKKDEEVLEVASGATTKIKVAYTEDSKTQKDDKGNTKTKTTAVSGKTYTVASKDGKLLVTNDKSQPAPKAESSIVEKGYTSLGKPDAVAAAIPTRALKEGDDCPELAAALQKELAASSKDDKMTVDGTKVTFKGQDGDTGVFDVELSMRGDMGFMKMLMPLKGKFVLRIADSWPTQLTLEGPIEVDTGDNKKGGIDGEGTIKVTSTYTYK